MSEELVAFYEENYPLLNKSILIERLC